MLQLVIERKTGTVVLIRLSGELEFSNVHRFADAVESLVLEGKRHILVDTTDLRYADVGAFRTLDQCATLCHKCGGKMAVVAARVIKRIQEIGQLEAIFQSVDNLDDGLLLLGADENR